MAEIAKTIMLIGVLTLFVGVVLYVFGKIPGAGKLPGDIFIKKIPHFVRNLFFAGRNFQQ